MKAIGYLAVTLGSWLAASVGFAASHYVRAGATGAGTGADWANAFSSLPATLQRGDTYYVASGTYGGYTFDDPVSGSTYITIVKATSDNSGSVAGWQASYGTGPAIFGQLTFGRSYYVFDGVTGGGPGSWSSGHGFKVNVTSSGGSGITLSTSSMVNPTNIEILHTQIVFANNAGLPYPSPGQAAPQDAFMCMYGAKNVRIAYSSAQYSGRTHFYISGDGNGATAPTGWVIEYSFFEKSGYSGFGELDPHSEICSAGFPWVTVSDMTWRYNYFLDWGSTGGLILRAGADWYIYGNVFRWSQDWGETSNNGVVGTLTAYGVSNVYIYNNTFIDLVRGGSGKIFPLATFRNNVRAFNNLWFNSPTVAFGTDVIHDYNWFGGVTGSTNEANGQVGAGDPFVDYAGGDFRLASATNPGTILTTPYDTDADGSQRGADGTWDRGAYEYGGNVPTCGASAGQCCATGELCEGGVFAASSDCGRSCCVGGSCQLPPPTCKNQGYSCCALCASGAQPTLDAECGSGVCCAACSNPIFSAEACVEAELGELVAPLAVGNDPAASGSAFVVTPVADQGAVHFAFDIADAGDYAMQARVLTPSLTQDSFYVGQDGAAVQGVPEESYDAVLSATFVWDVVSRRGVGGTPDLAMEDPKIWQLTPGRHTFSFWGREAGAQLDQVILRRCAPGSNCAGLGAPECGTPALDDGGPADGGTTTDTDVPPSGGDAQPPVISQSGCDCSTQPPAVLACWLGALMLARRAASPARRR